MKSMALKPSRAIRGIVLREVAGTSLVKVCRADEYPSVKSHRLLKRACPPVSTCF